MPEELDAIAGSIYRTTAERRDEQAEFEANRARQIAELRAAEERRRKGESPQDPREDQDAKERTPSAPDPQEGAWEDAGDAISPESVSGVGEVEIVDPEPSLGLSGGGKNLSTLDDTPDSEPPEGIEGEEIDAEYEEVEEVEDVSAWRDEVLEASAAVTAAMEEIRDLEAKVKDAKEDLKAAEKNWRDRVSELQEIIDSEGPGGQQRLPFKGDSTLSVHSEDDEEEDWRDMSIGEVDGIPTRALKGFGEAGLVTLGELTDWLGDDRNHIGDLKGIGEKAQQDVEDALEAFWQRRAASNTTVEPVEPEGD